MLDAVSWNSSQSGFWDVAGDWSTGKVPTATDDVTISQPGVMVTVRSGTQAVHSITSSGLLAISGGSLTVAADSRLNGGLTMTAGTLTVNADMSLSGGSNWSGGSLKGPGTFANMGTLTIDSTGASAPLIEAASFNNDGTLTHTGSGNLEIGAGVTFVNQSDGVFDLQSDAGLTGLPGAGAGPVFVNSGMFQKAAGTGTSTIADGLTFEHTGGTVDVESGTVAIVESGGNETGATFAVAQGATLDLSSPDPANMLEGSYTGSGAGSVVFGNGFLSTGSNGAKFNFPVGLFQWTGGSIVNQGGFTNQGAITLAGSQDKTFGQGLFDNTGTILQTGGRFLLNQNTTLFNESSGTYQLETDISLSGSFGGFGGANPKFVNDGTFLKSAGTSATTIDWDLDNTGAFEVDAGTLTVTGNVVQAANGTLSAGTWDVAGGGSLTLKSPGNLATDQATVGLSGAGSTFTNLAGLASNAGTLSLLAGASLSTPAGFNNLGKLTLGPSSTLAVNGAYTQSAAGTLDVQLGGSPSSAQSGRLNVSGSATLGGALTADPVGGYAPAVGDQFSVLSYGSQTGNFATLNLPETSAAFFQAAVNATSTILAASQTTTDLAVQTIDNVSPNPVAVGQNLTVKYTVANLGSQTTPVSSWVDSVYLSASTAIDSSAVLLRQVTHSGALAANGTYQQTVTAPLPPLVPGNYHVVVVVDSQSEVPNTNRANGTLASSSTVETTVPALTLGLPATGTVSNGGSDYFQLNLAAGQEVTLVAASSVSAFASLFIRVGSLPDTQHYDQTAFIAGQSQQPLELLAIEPGTYYVLLLGGATAGAGTSFSLTASNAALSLTGLGATSGGNVGQATVPLVGTAFQAGMQASLIGADGLAHAAQSVLVSSATQAFATFDLTGLAAGTYDVQVSAAGQTAKLTAGYSVVAGTAGKIQASVTLPSSPQVGQPGGASLAYSNTGGADLIAPLLVLSINSEAQFRLRSTDPYTNDNLLLIAASPAGPAGVLRAGQQVSVPLSVLPTGTDPLDVDVAVEAVDSTDPIDYQSLEQQIRPAGVSDAVWNPIFQQVQQEAGPTWGGFVKLLAQTATELGLQGPDPTSALAVFAALVQNISLAINGGVSGQIFLDGPRQPLAGALVTFSTADGTEAAQAATAADGSFQLPGVAPGTYNVSVAGYVTSAQQQITVPASGALSGLAITVTPGGLIAGNLLGPDNGPISGETVVVQATGTTSYSARTDADGHYLITGLPADTYTVSTGGGAFAPATTGSLVLASNGAQTGNDFTLAAAATVQGHVIALSGGAAISGATVTITAPDGSTQQTQTDSNGKYSFTGLAAGNAQISVQAPGFASVSGVAVNLTAGQATTASDIALAAGAAINVTVTDAASNPIASALLTLSSNAVQVAQAGTDASGQAQFTNLAAGSYVLTIQASQAIETTDNITLNSGQSLSKSYTLAAAGQIAGVVHDVAGGALANVPVTIMAADGTTLEVTTATDGSYQIDTLPLGSYAVTVGVAPGIDRQDVQLTSASSQATANFTVAGVTLSGQVLASDGTTPVEAAQVSLMENGSVVVDATTDANGLYHFEGVSAGAYSVIAHGAAGISHLLNLTVGTVDLDVSPIELSGLTLSGSVQDGSGAAVVGAAVSLVPAFVNSLALAMDALTDANGDFSVTGLAAGQYTVAVHSAKTGAASN